MKQTWAEFRQDLLQGNVTPYSFLSAGERDSEAGRTPGAEAVEVESERKLFPESDCVEWTFGLRTTGDADTPILSDLHSLDLSLAPLPEGAKATIHAVHDCGWGHRPFALHQAVLECGKSFCINQPGGAKSNGTSLPFINLDLGGRGFFRRFRRHARGDR